jgi:hypothetical protein
MSKWNIRRPLWTAENHHTSWWARPCKITGLILMVEFHAINAAVNNMGAHQRLVEGWAEFIEGGRIRVHIP